MERSFEPPARFEQVEPERGGRRSALVSVVCHVHARFARNHRRSFGRQIATETNNGFYGGKCSRRALQRPACLRKQYLNGKFIAQPQRHRGHRSERLACKRDRDALRAALGRSDGGGGARGVDGGSSGGSSRGGGFGSVSATAAAAAAGHGRQARGQESERVESRTRE